MPKKQNYMQYLKKFDKAKGTKGGMLKSKPPKHKYTKKNSRGQHIQMTHDESQRYPGLVDKYYNKS